MFCDQMLTLACVFVTSKQHVKNNNRLIHHKEKQTLLYLIYAEININHFNMSSIKVIPRIVDENISVWIRYNLI